MEEFENTPQIPPQPAPDTPPVNPLALNTPRLDIPFRLDDGAGIIQAREIPEPLRTPDSPLAPETPTPPGSPQAPPQTPDSLQRPGTPDSPSSPDSPLGPDSPSSPDSPPSQHARDEARPIHASEQSSGPGVRLPISTVSLPPLPPEPITPKPRAIFITATLLAITLIIWFAGSREGWFGFPDAQQVAQAQLLDLDQGHWRAAYELFSPRYRGEVSFETWRDMALMHSRMFHTREMHFDGDQEWNGGAALEAHLLADSGDRYLARFKLVYTDGHWWVDDLHWGREQSVKGQITT